MKLPERYERAGSRSLSFSKLSAQPWKISDAIKFLAVQTCREGRRDFILF